MNLTRLKTQAEKVVGHEFEETIYEYNEKDVALYALAVGASQEDACDEVDLTYTFNNQLDDTFVVLPTFSVLFPNSIIEQLLGLETLVFDPSLLLHGEQYVEVPGPLPASAKVSSRGRVIRLQDKGKAAIIEIETESFDTATGKRLATNRTTCVLRGAGGFSSPSSLLPPPRGRTTEHNGAATSSVAPPTRSSTPAANAAKESQTPASVPQSYRVVEQRIPPSQALLYRLCGDLNPLHADPQFAEVAGYPRPILHGLCTLAYATRAVLRSFAAGDVAAFRWVKGRFLSHVFPGETLITRMQRPGPLPNDSHVMVVHFQCVTKERGSPVLSGSLAFSPSQQATVAARL